MKIELKNFCKIAEASIEINGITVIMGENSTGKSTVGKALFCMFNAFHDLDETLEHYKIMAIEKAVHNFFDFLSKDSTSLYSRHDRTLARRATTEFLNFLQDYEIDNLNINELVNVIKNISDSEQIKPDSFNNTIKKLESDLSDIFNISEKKFTERELSDYLDAVFKMQVNNALTGTDVAELKMIIKQLETVATISNGEIKINQTFDLRTPAIFINTPLIIDDVENHDTKYFSFHYTDQLLEKLINKSSENPVESIVRQDNLSRTIEAIEDKISGRFYFEKGEYKYTDSNGITLYASNLSSGLKTYALIKILLLNGSLEENGMLILDEPEIHLHPDWQVDFAEVLVLLQKELQINILLTTHSSTFLESLQVFSEKYETVDKFKYYLTREENHGVFIDDISNEVVPTAYNKFSTAFKTLDKVTLGYD